KNPAVFDEQKLRHLNGRHLRALSTGELTARLEQFTGRPGLHDAVEVSRDKIQTLGEFWPLVSFVFDGPVDDPKAFAATIGREGGIEALTAARDALASADPFDVDTIEPALRGVVERLQTKPGRVFQPVRVAIAGQTVSPGIFESLALLGKDESLARIDAALARAREGG
ncbi:MAG: glutamate--tRNA ligase, partial [Solirubrobacteraceae bacterium]